MEILWEEEGFQFGFKRWQGWAVSKVLWEWIPNVGSKAIHKIPVLNGSTPFLFHHLGVWFFPCIVHKMNSVVQPFLVAVEGTMHAINRPSHLSIITVDCFYTYSAVQCSWADLLPFTCILCMLGYFNVSIYDNPPNCDMDRAYVTFCMHIHNGHPLFKSKGLFVNSTQNFVLKKSWGGRKAEHIMATHPCGDNAQLRSTWLWGASAFTLRHWLSLHLFHIACIHIQHHFITLYHQLNMRLSLMSSYQKQIHSSFRFFTPECALTRV